MGANGDQLEEYLNNIVKGNFFYDHTDPTIQMWVSHVYHYQPAQQVNIILVIALINGYHILF